jgi:hypothetical protein
MRPFRGRLFGRMSLSFEWRDSRLPLYRLLPFRRHLSGRTRRFGRVCNCRTFCEQIGLYLRLDHALQIPRRDRYGRRGGRAGRPSFGLVCRGGFSSSGWRERDSGSGVAVFRQRLPGQNLKGARRSFRRPADKLMLTKAAPAVSAAPSPMVRPAIIALARVPRGWRRRSHAEGPFARGSGSWWRSSLRSGCRFGRS